MILFEYESDFDCLVAEKKNRVLTFTLTFFCRFAFDALNAQSALLVQIKA